MDYLVSQQVLPPPSPPSSLSPHQWENRGEFSVGENKHKGRFSEGDRPAFALFLSLVCVSWERKKKKNCGWSRTGQIPRNSTSDITCSHPLLMEGEDLERDGAGEIKGGFRKLTGGQGGVTLRPSVTQQRWPLIMQMGTTCTDNHGLSRAFVWTLFTRTSNGPRTGKSHESELVIVFPSYTCCFHPFQDTRAVKHELTSSLNTWLGLCEITTNRYNHYCGSGPVAYRSSVLWLIKCDLWSWTTHFYSLNWQPSGQSPLLVPFSIFNYTTDILTIYWAHSPGGNKSLTNRQNWRQFINLFHIHSWCLIWFLSCSRADSSG